MAKREEMTKIEREAIKGSTTFARINGKHMFIVYEDTSTYFTLHILTGCIKTQLHSRRNILAKCWYFPPPSHPSSRQHPRMGDDDFNSSPTLLINFVSKNCQIFFFLSEASFSYQTGGTDTRATHVHPLSMVGVTFQHVCILWIQIRRLGISSSQANGKKRDGVVFGGHKEDTI